MKLCLGKVPLLYALFLTSGFAALVYEVLWTRFLSLSFGSNIGATGVVVAVFLCGIAGGGLLFGKIVDQHQRPLRLFALLEITIALYALAFPSLWRWAEQFYVQSAAQLPQEAFFSAGLQMVFGAVLLLPPTLCMGGTLPVLSTVFAQVGLSNRIGGLYASNVLGAASGAFVSGYLLIPYLGLLATGYLACGLNIVVAAVAWRLGQSNMATTDSSVAVAAGEQCRASLVLPCTLLIGFSALACQLLWTRVLLLFLGSTTYAFSAILAATLLCMGLGSASFNRLRRRYSTVTLFTFLPLLSALYLVLTLPFYDQIPYAVLSLDRWAGESWLWYSLRTLLLVTAVVGVPSFLSGTLFPAAVALYADKSSATGSNVGKVLLCNTLGSGSGSLVGAFVLVPVFGLFLSLKLVASLLLLTGVLFAAANRRLQRGGEIRVVICVAVCVGAIIAFPTAWDQKRMNSGVYYYGASYPSATGLDAILAGRHLLAVYEGKETTVSLWDVEESLYFAVNGKVDGGSGPDMETQILLGQLPILLHGRAQSALVIGLGTGATTAAVMRAPLQWIDTVEISPEVIEAAKNFSLIDFSAANPKQKLHIADARNFLLVNRGKYDVIVSEPSNPWQTGNANLFTQEFFRLVVARMTEDGVFCQWIPLYELDINSTKTLLQTFMSVFPHVHLFVENGNVFLLGTLREKRFDYQQVNQMVVNYYQGAPYKYIGNTVDLLAKYYLFSTEIARSYVGNAKINSDMVPRIEYSPRYNLSTRIKNEDGRLAEDELFALLDRHKQALPVTNLGENDDAVKKNIGRIIGEFAERRKDFSRPRRDGRRWN